MPSVNNLRMTVSVVYIFEPTRRLRRALEAVDPGFADYMLRPIAWRAEESGAEASETVVQRVKHWFVTSNCDEYELLRTVIGDPEAAAFDEWWTMRRLEVEGEIPPAIYSRGPDCEGKGIL